MQEKLREIEKIGEKVVHNYNDYEKINTWIAKFNANESENVIGYLSRGRNDFQNKSLVFLINSKKNATNSFSYIDGNNLIVCSVYLAVQHIIPADWLNDRDQFLYPSDGWLSDFGFQNDCLTYTLFHNSNNIQSKYGTNHWIPFSENEVGCAEAYQSHFMLDFISGKLAVANENIMFDNKIALTSRTFSKEATSVFTAGKELYRYYHKQRNAIVNASFYDIREHFQGREKGRMNNKSNDEIYNKLLTNLRSELKILAKKIEPKIYDYGFLLR